MNKPNVVWLSLLSPEEARRTLEGFENRREGVTVFCGEMVAPITAPWAVGSGPISLDGILHESSAQYQTTAGGWWDEEEQTYLWESVTLFVAREDALACAELRGEKCIFNIVTGEEVWM